MSAHALVQLVIETVPIDSVQPNGYNPNRLTDEEMDLLELSMREDGWTRPLLVRSGTRDIVDGEHRWTIARTRLGMREVPVVFIELTDEQMRVSTLRHGPRTCGNERSELVAQVYRRLDELGAAEWAQTSLLVTEAEIGVMLDGVAAPELPAPPGGSADEARRDTIRSPRPTGDDGSDPPEESISRMHVSMSETVTAQQRGLRESVVPGASGKAVEETVQRSASLRLMLSFRGEDASAVQAALGDSPAEALLRLCDLRLAGAL